MATIRFDQRWISIITRRGRSILHQIFEGIDTSVGQKGGSLQINKFQWMGQFGIEARTESTGSRKIECGRILVRCSFSIQLKGGSIMSRCVLKNDILHVFLFHL